MFKTKKAEVKVVRMTEYDGVMIYVMQYKTMFQYLFSWKGHIYQDHLFLKPRWWKYITVLFGSPLYNSEEQDYGEQVCLSGAMRSIEALCLESEIGKEKIPVEK